MILPKKHLSLEESYFGFGAYLLELLTTPMNVDDLWELYKLSIGAKKYPVKFTMNQFILALDYLFLIGAINQTDEGMIWYETN